MSYRESQDDLSGKRRQRDRGCERQHRRCAAKATKTNTRSCAHRTQLLSSSTAARVFRHLLAGGGQGGLYPAWLLAMSIDPQGRVASSNQLLDSSTQDGGHCVERLPGIHARLVEDVFQLCYGSAERAHLRIRHDVNEYADQDNGCAHSAKISRVRAPDAVEAIAVEIFRQCECSGQVVSMAVIDRGPGLTECGSRSFI